jgi:ubiquinone/menaquinone biosynthesis C-methylase UbiE
MNENAIIMSFTGERFTPETEGNVELEHLHRYLQASEFVAGLTVLDIASGEGYGSFLLSDTAAQVIGVDISNEAVAHAQKKYHKPNLEFKTGSCSAIPLPDASVDAVVSFETLEHHDEHDTMMEQIKRVLRPGGIVLISSPDKHNYSVVPDYKNEFHVKELFEEEFRHLLNRYFKNTLFFGQRILYGSMISAHADHTPVSHYVGKSDAVQTGPGIANPRYWICLASDAKLPSLASSIFEQPFEDAELVRQIRIDNGLKLAEVERQSALLQQHLKDTEDNLHRVLQSTSWVVTKPLRFLWDKAAAVLAPIRR